jgi:hypothetical protein
VKTIRIIIINLVIFLVLLAGINWACGIYLKKHDAQANREELPNFKNDRDYAREVFKDYNSVKHQYEPFTGWKCLPYLGKTLTISENGERATKTSNQGGRSIHFFGGSTTWGEGSDDLHTIPALVAAKTQSYQVFNHGQLAYNSRQELDALITLYSKDIKPDVVIFYDGVNDAAFLCPKEITELPAHRLVPMYREKLYAGSTAALKEIGGKLFVTNILKLVNKFAHSNTEKDSPYDCVSNPAKAEEIADIMMKNWEMAHEMVTSRGGRFVAILQPAAFVGHPQISHLKLDSDLGENFNAIYSRIKQKIDEKKHPWIYDLTSSFDNDDYIFIDFCHVSPNGNEIIASKITNIIGKDYATMVSTIK